VGTRYFLTYRGVKLPLQLAEELAPETLANRNTWFRADYDARVCWCSFGVALVSFGVQCKARRRRLGHPKQGGATRQCAPKGTSPPGCVQTAPRQRCGRCQGAALGCLPRLAAEPFGHNAIPE